VSLPEALVLLVPLGAAAALAVALLRANELFCLRLTEGRVRVLRGRLPQGLLDDIVDVLRQPPLASGTLRGLSEGGRAVIRSSAPLSDAQQQRLRNVIARWPVVRIRNAPRPR
jgi:hypothetical protein